MLFERGELGIGGPAKRAPDSQATPRARASLSARAAERRRVSGRLLHPPALLGHQRFETWRVRKQDVHLRPQSHIGGHIGSKGGHFG